MTTRPRDLAQAAWDSFLKSGREPIMEVPTKYGTCTITILVRGFGVGFYWEIDGTEDFDTGLVKPYFDAILRKRHDAYFMSWAQIDRDGSSLDLVLQFIYDNVIEGVLLAYNLLPEADQGEQP